MNLNNTTCIWPSSKLVPEWVHKEPVQNVWNLLNNLDYHQEAKHDLWESLKKIMTFLTPFNGNLPSLVLYGAVWVSLFPQINMMNMRSICGPFFGLKGTSHVTLFDEVSKLSSCNVFTCTCMNLKCYMCCFFFPILDLKVLKYSLSI